MPNPLPNAIYVDPYLFLALLLLTGIGIERLFIDLVRFVDRHWFRKPEAPSSPILTVVEGQKKNVRR